MFNSRWTGVRVVRDGKYPDMFRVEAEGRLSDMVNLSRARDAAVCWVLRDLNRQETVAEAS